MAREFTGTIPFEIMGVDIIAEVRFTATPPIPATHDDPAEGGEIEILGVEKLYTEHWRTLAGKQHRTRTDLECPDWLLDIIVEQGADEGDLMIQADFDEPDE